MVSFTPPISSLLQSIARLPEHELLQAIVHSPYVEKVQEIIEPIFLSLRRSFKYSIAKPLDTLYQKTHLSLRQLHIEPGPHLDTLLPTDPALKIEKLSNGLTSYVQHNHQPAPGFASLRLVVKAGSAFETEEERGLAHFVEHLVFGGSKNFANEEMIKYLESIGAKFGADTNAYTSFNETVYKLDMPLNHPEALDKALLILREFATRATMPDKCIDRERGVILDELRRGRGVSRRYAEKLYEVLYDGTPYPKRLPIGLESVILNAKPEIIRNFYQKWYTSDRMAIVAVGDFDEKSTQELIHKHFDDIPAPATKREGPTFKRTEHKDRHYLIHSDPEDELSTVSIFFKHESNDDAPATINDVKWAMIDNFYHDMLNARLAKLVQLPDASILRAKSKLDNDLSYVQNYNVVAIAKEGQIPQALEVLFREVKRVKEHGFARHELDQVKEELLSTLEHAFKEKEKTASSLLAKRCVKNFKDNGVLTSREKLIQVQMELIDSITVDDIKDWACTLAIDENQVVSIAIPEKSGIAPPKAEELEKIFQKVEQETLAPFQSEEMPRHTLMPRKPSAGKITSSTTFESVGTTVLKLENGMTILVKPTELKKDQVVVSGFALGGKADATLEERVSALLADEMASESGLGGLAPSQLSNLLTGKNIDHSKKVSTYHRALSAASSVKDFETALQILHLSFTNPGYREEVFPRIINTTEEVIRNAGNSPETIYDRRISAINSQNHPMLKPLEVEELKKANFKTAAAYHRQWYENPADFTLVIAGNVDVKNIQPLLKTYLASIPKKREGRTEAAHLNIKFPNGITKEKVFAGKEPATETCLTFPVNISSDLDTSLMGMWACDILQTRLQERLRFTLGKTYGARSTYAPSPIPKVTNLGRASIDFSCEPKNVAILMAAAFEEIKKLQTMGPTQKEIDALREIKKIHRKEALQNNTGWTILLTTYQTMGYGLERIRDYENILASLTQDKVKSLLKNIFDLSHYTAVTLYPKEEAK